MKHVPALDGVRGMAILFVLGAHASASRLEFAGPTGVTVFFVLSGYLITSLLLMEDAQTGQIRLLPFYARRALRLYPALLLAVTGAWVLYAATGQAEIENYWLDAVPTLLYLRDFMMAMGSSGFLFDHTWSLAVEEQFYLVWPVALIALIALSARRVPLIASVTIVAGLALAWRVVSMFLYGPERVYFAPDTNAFALLAGCSLATVLYGRLQGRGSTILALASTAALAGIPVLVGFLTSNSWVARNWITLITVCLAIVLLTAAPGTSFLESRILRWFGQISYGLYLWHIVFLNLRIDGEPLRGWQRGAALGAAILVAWLSFRYFERPILRLKSRFSAPRPVSLDEGLGADPKS
ncbi:acyltransferase [Leifsonia sp. AK011]|uniref:acyltransferase family protein n=1 Tax=Leifsonia sp. AK011 TaxID=2723075 RepID=UPI00211C1433|nr:acyltransferase [Leifsonia sp. AK011]